MAARDNVLFHASVASGTAAGTVVPLSLLYGIENVRQGYGTPVLKHVRAFFSGGITGYGLPIEIKNSNWIDAAGVIAAPYADNTSFNRNSLNFMRGRDKVLQPNTSWMINAVLPVATTSAMEIYVIFEIAYSSVEGISTENVAGSPVMKKCGNASVTGAANTPISIGVFDNLLQNVSYVLSEVSNVAGAGSNPLFLIMEGFSNQKGLTRILPLKPSGLTDQIEGSVTLTKQTYNLAIISAAAVSAANVTINLELIASSN